MIKKIILIVAIVIIAISIYPCYKFIQIQIYKSSVDKSLYGKLVEMNTNIAKYQKNLLLPSDKFNIPGNELTWGDIKVRLNSEDVKVKENSKDTISYDIVQVEEENDGVWKNLIREKAGFCNKAIIAGEKLLCRGRHFGDIIINIIDKDGRYTIKTLVKTENNGVQKTFSDDKYLYIVWVDYRLNWPQPLQLLSDAPIYSGPDLVMVGELNLDNLQFTEHVIKYKNDYFP